MSSFYIFRVKNIAVIDGDTVDCDIDLGFDIWLRKQRIRLWGIDAPEVRTRDLDEKQKGIAAKIWLIEILNAAKGIRLQTNEYKPKGKFGRILGTFHIQEEIEGAWANINIVMLDLGLVKPYYGGKRK